MLSQLHSIAVPLSVPPPTTVGRWAQRRDVRDGRHVDVSAVPAPSRPGALGIGLFVDDAQRRSCAVYQEGAQVPIALARKNAGLQLSRQ